MPFYSVLTIVNLTSKNLNSHELCIYSQNIYLWRLIEKSPEVALCELSAQTLIYRHTYTPTFMNTVYVHIQLTLKQHRG